MQKALKHKLDRDPQVMQAIEDAKRQILARAYIERAAAASSMESWEEIAGWGNRQHRLAGVAT